jgi:hypothetical protein
MTTALHKDLTGSDLHEPKGAASASSGQVYQADGAGSGAWAKIGTTAIDTSAIFDTNKFSILVQIPDISTADFVLVPLPFACTLNRVTSVLHAAITVADATLTITNSTGPATVGTITVANASSAEGDIDQLTASVNNTFTADTYVKVATDGGSTTTAKVSVLLEFTRTA